MNPTCAEIFSICSSLRLLYSTFCCSKKLFPSGSMDTIKGPNSFTRQFHKVSGIQQKAAKARGRIDKFNRKYGMNQN